MIIKCINNNDNDNDNIDNITCFTENDMVYNKDNEGNIYSNGFLINSLLMNNNCSVINSNDNDIFDSNTFENLAIPTGLYFMSSNNQITNHLNSDKINIIDDTLFSKLLDLQINSKEIKNKHRKSKKNNKKLKNKTRKNKI